MEAFIFLQVQVGEEARVARLVAGLDGVSSVDVVAGPHDLVVRADADTIDELGKLVLRPIQAIGGVTRTLTCPLMHRWTWLGERSDEAPA